MRIVLGEDSSSVEQDGIFNDGKSQSGSSCTAGAGLLYTVKFIENKRKLVCRDHISIVGNRNCHCFAFCMDLHQDPLSICPVFNGISDQIVKPVP